jgi:hypothetical protein
LAGFLPKISQEETAPSRQRLQEKSPGFQNVFPIMPFLWNSLDDRLLGRRFYPGKRGYNLCFKGISSPTYSHVSVGLFFSSKDQAPLQP